MDTNTWRPTRGTEAPMDTSDWRTQLQPDSRQRIVNKMMETLKRHIPFSGQEGLHELQNIAQRFEEKIYTAATSQPDYLRKISLKMLTMETKSHNMNNPMPSNPGGPSNQPTEAGLLQPRVQNPGTSSTSLDSTAQTGQSNGGDWQEEVYQKIKIMEEKYLPELNEVYEKIVARLQQHDSLPQQPKSDQLNRLKMFKTMLEKLLAFLQVPKGNISPGFKEKLGVYEKQIVNFINTNRPRKPLQPGQHPPPIHSIPQSQSQLSHENQINTQLQPTNNQGSVAAMPQNNMSSLNSMPGVSTAQQSMMNPMQPGASLDSGQGSHLNSLRHFHASSLQQNTVSALQQNNMSPISSQGGVNVIQPNLSSFQ
ncbi:hypothetical protein QN277_011065 [Acacia crassicarpa]|uniref:Mediator complex subunit 15 KIX domain-containing protein n=1 Tax=Acacia crassicarpa TaxID=499986 RepID=A0AAE1M4L9_9FABA|nr:hypothetical protein QN277_011065 [Acacia crassicarpa]